MSMNNLTIDGEFRYIIQWFNEWSELQRDDFIPIMVDYLTGTDSATTVSNTTATAATTNMNGLENHMERSLNLNDKPMSLFQCRVKLFCQWNRRWPIEFKEKLQQKISEIDNKVGERIKEEVTKKHNGCGGSLTNGYALGSNDVDDIHNYEYNGDTMTKEHYPHNASNTNQNESHLKEDHHQLQQQQDVIVVTNTVTLNDPMREVLSNETSVDDIEPNNEQQQVIINRAGVEDNDNVAHDNNLNEDSNNSHAREPVEQVVQMRNLQISEDGHEDVTASVSASVQQQQQQQQSPHTAVVASVPVTVTVNPVVVVAAQSMATNAEVPLVA